ncbi:MAG: hypothetical protein MZV64_31880 [Ignavibacteriales bacterium]|nr:hypothetical protein [Ignavibacteriales bacterium]
MRGIAAISTEFSDEAKKLLLQGKHRQHQGAEAGCRECGAAQHRRAHPS